jgi:hypothetical protein
MEALGQEDNLVGNEAPAELSPCSQAFLVKLLTVIRKQGFKILQIR